MTTITREQAKDLRNAFECWQQDYDPTADKEQYEMFGLGVVAMDVLLASLDAGSDSNNHPAHGPLSNDRLHRIREILRKAAAQSDGGNLGYAMADAVKAFDELLEVRKAEPVGYYRKGSDGFYFASPTEQRPGTIPLYRHAQLAPVADGWLVDAKRLAELHGTSFVVFRHGDEPQCADSTKVVISLTDIVTVKNLENHSDEK
ncbi:hypothetical protein QD840_002072 [Citrobacter koseri]|nr:hypothetical protein [Citrobacter koseri]